MSRPPGEFYLIDHGLCFYRQNWTPEEILASVSDLTTRSWTDFLQNVVSLQKRVDATPRIHAAASMQINVDIPAAMSATKTQNFVPTVNLVALVTFLESRRNSRPRYCQFGHWYTHVAVWRSKMILQDVVNELSIPPRTSNHRGEWCPLYLEPSQGSGEQDVIGVVGGDDTQVYRTAGTQSVSFGVSLWEGLAVVRMGSQTRAHRGPRDRGPHRHRSFELQDARFRRLLRR